MHPNSVVCTSPPIEVTDSHYDSGVGGTENTQDGRVGQRAKILRSTRFKKTQQNTTDHNKRKIKITHQVKIHIADIIGLQDYTRKTFFF